MRLENQVDPLNLKSFGFHFPFFLFSNLLNFARKDNLKMSTQTDQHAPLQGWKYRLVIDSTFFAFLLSIIADALLSIFSIDYRLFYAFCLHFIDW